MPLVYEMKKVPYNNRSRRWVCKQPNRLGRIEPQAGCDMPDLESFDPLASPVSDGGWSVAVVMYRICYRLRVVNTTIRRSLRRNDGQIALFNFFAGAVLEVLI
jgi:hypothetical protein